MLDINESRRICDAATPGPWCQSGIYQVLKHPCADLDDLEEGGKNMPSRHDAVFIAHARTALPAALDEIERLRESGKMLIATIDRLRTDLREARRLLDELNNFAISIGFEGNTEIASAVNEPS